MDQKNQTLKTSPLPPLLLPPPQPQINQTKQMITLIINIIHSFLLLLFLINLLQILFQLRLRIILQLLPLILIEYLCPIKYPASFRPVQLNILISFELPSPSLLSFRIVFDFGCICYDYLLFGDRVLAFDELLVEAEEDID